MADTDIHHFKVRLIGKGLILELQPGQVKTGGFVTTRIVSANSRENGIIKAAADIKLDSHLAKFVRNPPDNPYTVTVEEVEEVDEFVELHGFTFFTASVDKNDRGILAWLKRRFGFTSIRPVD